MAANPFGGTNAFSFNKPGGAFGTPTQSAPAPGGLFGSPFGAASTPAQQSTPAFGFGNAGTPSAFGASTPGFGLGANTTPGFGQSAPSLFGASSAGAFGASSAPSTGLFGAPASGASTFGSFSAPATTSTSAPGFGFGSSTPSMFGASSTPSLFGGATSNALVPASNAAGSNLFGGLGRPAQMAPATFSTQQQPGSTADGAMREIAEIKAAYTPNSSSYKFQHLFLNVVEPNQRIKPPGVDEMRWRQAMAAAGGPDNPDKLWPCAAHGFRDLLARSGAQAAALDENAGRLKALNDLAHRLASKHATELKQRAADVQKKHVELAHKLLHTYRLLDALESRLASSIGYRADQAREREAVLSRKLGAVEAEVAPASATSLQRRLESVSSAARSRVGVQSGPGLANTRLDERSSAQLLAVLKDHAAGVAKLQALLKRDALDAEIMRKELAGQAGGNGGRSLMMLE